MAAAVLGRMDSAAYPDSLPDVLDGLEAEGAFGEREDSSRAGSPMRRVLGRLFAASAAIRASGASGGSSESRLRAISADAVRAALSGADPVSGALEFRVIPPPRTGDFLFDDSREDAYRARLAEELAGYRAVIGGVGFR